MLHGNKKLKIKSNDSKAVNRKSNLEKEMCNKLMEMKNIGKHRPNTKDIFIRKNSPKNNINKELKNHDRGNSKLNINDNSEKMKVKLDIKIKNNKNNNNKIGLNINKEDFSSKKLQINNLKIINNNKNQKIFLGKNMISGIKKESQSDKLLKIGIKNNINNFDSDENNYII